MWILPSEIKGPGSLKKDSVRKHWESEKMHLKIAPQLDRVAPQLPNWGAKLHLKINLKCPGLPTPMPFCYRNMTIGLHFKLKNSYQAPHTSAISPAHRSSTPLRCTRTVWSAHRHTTSTGAPENRPCSRSIWRPIGLCTARSCLLLALLQVDPWTYLLWLIHFSAVMLLHMGYLVRGGKNLQ